MFYENLDSDANENDAAQCLYRELDSFSGKDSDAEAQQGEQRRGQGNDQTGGVKTHAAQGKEGKRYAYGQRVDTGGYSHRNEVACAEQTFLAGGAFFLILFWAVCFETILPPR